MSELKSFLSPLAKTEAEDVIGSGIASFYPNYADTWSLANEDIRTNKESIWGVAYSQDLTTTSNCIPYRYKTDAGGSKMQYNSLITRTGYSRGGSAMLLMFVSMWNLLEKNRTTDQRTEATLLDAYTIAPGLEGSSKNYPSIKDTAIYYCALDGNSAAGQAKQAWAKKRYRIQFMYNGDIPVYTTGDPATAKPTEAAKAKSDVYADNRYNTYKIGGWCSFPGIKKFLDNVYNTAYPTYDLSGRDAIVFRLAEMYLIKAEAELNTSGSAAALATLNQLRTVRAKAGKVNTLTGTVDINTILEERAIELCGEQQRWFDLKRTKTLVARVKAYNAQGAGQIKDIHYLRPIPQAQLDAVTNKTDAADPKGFWQNPGY